MDTQLQNLEQGTEAWRRWRRDKLGASLAPIIMSTSKFSTPLQLWRQLKGLEPEFQGNWATERGTLLEPVARGRYELKHDLDMPPVTVVHPRYKFITASLDGWNEAAKIGLEIKVAGKDVFQAAKANVCHESYYPQVQQQMMVTGAVEWHFFVCKAEKDKFGNHNIVDDALVKVKPDLEYQKELLMKLLEFKRFLDEEIPPPLTDRDWLEADDQSTVILFSKIKPIKIEMRRKLKIVEKLLSEVNELESQLEPLREEAIEHVETIGHPKVKSVGVSMSKDKNGIWSVRLDAEGE